MGQSGAVVPYRVIAGKIIKGIEFYQVKFGGLPNDTLLPRERFASSVVKPDEIAAVAEGDLNSWLDEDGKTTTQEETTESEEAEEETK
jgi:hypothetical protein